MTFQHRAGVRPYTSSYEFAEPCVFVKQSIPPSFCPRIRLQRVNLLHLLSGSLIPKLREYFAEFLKRSSLTRLRILFSPTCVGFRYESTTSSLRHFSCMSRRNSFQRFYSPRVPVSGITVKRICLPHTPTWLDHHYRSMANVFFHGPDLVNNANSRVEEY